MAIQRVKPGIVTAQDGTYPELRGSRKGGLVSQDVGGRYEEAAYRKAMFFAATQAGQTTSAALTATYVGLVVSNPLGSSVNLAINKVSFGWAVLAAAVTTIGIGLGYSATTNVVHTTPVTPRSNFFGVGGAPVALADTTATLPAALFYYTFLGNTPTATSDPNGGAIDLEGSVIIPPGAYIATVTSVASAAAAFLASIQWEEIPL
jgi:hypothetical protein